MKLWFMAAIAAALLAVGTVRVYAADRTANGYIAIEAPYGTVDRPQDDSPMVLGRLTLSHLAGPVGVFFGGQVNVRKGMPWCKENKFQTGFELPLKSGVTAYTYFERRFDLNDNRFVGGLRYNFKSNY